MNIRKLDLRAGWRMLTLTKIAKMPYELVHTITVPASAVMVKSILTIWNAQRQLTCMSTHDELQNMCEWSRYKYVYINIYIYAYINDLDTNILSKRSKFVDNTKLCHRARNPDEIMELQEDINKLVEWANKWQMSFNVDKCSVMHIGHNNMKATITCPINNCRQQINRRI